jgi:hypothetical protein
VMKAGGTTSAPSSCMDEGRLILNLLMEALS